MSTGKQTNLNASKLGLKSGPAVSLTETYYANIMKIIPQCLIFADVVKQRYNRNLAWNVMKRVCISKVSHSDTVSQCV